MLICCRKTWATLPNIKRLAVLDDELKTSKTEEHNEQQQSLLDNEQEDDLERSHCNNSSMLSAGRKR